MVTHWPGTMMLNSYKFVFIYNTVHLNTYEPCNWSRAHFVFLDHLVSQCQFWYYLSAIWQPLHSSRVLGLENASSSLGTLDPDFDWLFQIFDQFLLLRCLALTKCDRCHETNGWCRWHKGWSSSGLSLHQDHKTVPRHNCCILDGSSDCKNKISKVREKNGEVLIGISICTLNNK